MGAWTIDKKYDPVFREIRECLQSEELDAEICRTWEACAFTRGLDAVSRGLMAFSDLPNSLDFLMSPLYCCRFIGVFPEMKSYSWGSFFPQREQGDRFMEELRLYQAGQEPVSETGLPWLFRSGSGKREEADPVQKRKLFRYFDITEQLPFAGQFLPPPTDCIYPRIIPGHDIYADGGRYMYLNIPMPEEEYLKMNAGKTVRLMLPEGSAAVLTFLKKPAAGAEQNEAVGYAENYTRISPPEKFRTVQLSGKGILQLCWYVAPGGADSVFCLHDPSLPHWAPFTAWYEKNRSGLQHGSREKLRRKGRELLDELYRIAEESAG